MALSNRERQAAFRERRRKELEAFAEIATWHADRERAAIQALKSIAKISTEGDEIVGRLTVGEHDYEVRLKAGAFRWGDADVIKRSLAEMAISDG